MKYFIIPVETGEGPCDTLARELKSPVPAPGNPLRSGPGNTHTGLLGALLLRIMYS